MRAEWVKGRFLPVGGAGFAVRGRKLKDSKFKAQGKEQGPSQKLRAGGNSVRVGAWYLEFPWSFELPRRAAVASKFGNSVSRAARRGAARLALPQARVGAGDDGAEVEPRPGLGVETVREFEGGEREDFGDGEAVGPD